MNSTAAQLIRTARTLSENLTELQFVEPVACVYNPLEYARLPFERYLSLYGGSSKRIVFVGMNPGPWGMAQTGIPFGEVTAVRDWIGIHEAVDQPEVSHPKRPIQGFNCARSEVSGRRLWGLMRERFGTADAFFNDHFVTNYCPLVFYEQSGRNRTPDKLKAAEKKTLFGYCDTRLAAVIEIFKSEWVIGVGRFTEDRILTVQERLKKRHSFQVTRILHPSPANPQANRGWAEQVSRHLTKLEIW